MDEDNVIPQDDQVVAPIDGEMPVEGEPVEGAEEKPAEGEEGMAE